ncbi:MULTISPECIES: ABC transporter permease [Pontibacillus]|uniref:ABC transporter permease n=1 Tax=Pontibacillus chungwhensis TaxID=265426 RepID=A0ABY8V3M0_9BACI|nr:MULTISPECIES: ABC transporter permease [Pontibacillus]MCD5322747.1 ABC transporter permease [Pontibacillus sp. HN14]WIG00019.1 ABC transporter permease [Pontibacillus chungwhensis]
MLSNQRFINVLIPIISVILGLLAGAIIMLCFGYNPIDGYSALYEGAFGNSYFTGETIVKVAPLILSGIAVAFAFRTGLFNIGVEGQVFVGWLASVWVGISFEAPMIIHLPLAILAAAVAGALWGFVPGFLKARFGVHEVIVSIMMNYIALYTCNALIRNVLTDRLDSTDRVADSASLSSQLFYDLTGSRLHWGAVIALLLAFVMWFILEKTTKGYELRSVGFNQNASNYAGMNVNRNIVYSFLISGSFAGVAGAMQGLGTYGNMFVQSSFTNIGFDGIAVALLGGNTALGSVFGAFLFGTLKNGAGSMPLVANIPKELVDIIVALIIFFVASGYIIRWALTRVKREEK